MTMSAHTIMQVSSTVLHGMFCLTNCYDTVLHEMFCRTSSHDRPLSTAHLYRNSCTPVCCVWRTLHQLLT